MTDEACREAEMFASRSSSFLLAAATALRLSLTAFSISGDHQGLGWRLTRPKGMKSLATISVRKAKRTAAAAEREREGISVVDSESRSKKRSHANKLSEILRKGLVVGAEDRRKKSGFCNW